VYPSSGAFVTGIYASYLVVLDSDGVVSLFSLVPLTRRTLGQSKEPGPREGPLPNGRMPRVCAS